MDKTNQKTSWMDCETRMDYQVERPISITLVMMANDCIIDHSQHPSPHLSPKVTRGCEGGSASNTPSLWASPDRKGPPAGCGTIHGAQP